MKHKFDYRWNLTEANFTKDKGKVFSCFACGGGSSFGYKLAGFDNQFLRGFFLQNGDNYFGSWFWSNSIDVMVLASAYLADRRAEMENFKLSTVAKFLGVSVSDDSLHNALYDIELTRAVYDIVKR